MFATFTADSLFCYRLIFCCMIYYHLCVYLPVIRQQQQTSWLFIIFGNFENKAAYEHSGTSPYRHIFSFLLDKNLQGGISGSHNRLVFTLLRNSQTVFQTICIILCSYQQCRRIPVALHLLYRLVLSFWASAVAQIVNNLSVMQETQVRSLGCGDPVGKEMATPFCILAWRNQWTEEPDGPHSVESQSWKQLSD